MTVIEWLLTNDTCASSKAICAVMTGSDIPLPEYPLTPDDFGRCYRLLKLFPEWVERMPEVTHHFPEWGPLAKDWGNLVELYEKCCDKGGRLPQKDSPSRQRLTNRMMELAEKVQVDAGWY